MLSNIKNITILTVQNHGGNANKHVNAQTHKNVELFSPAQSKLYHTRHGDKKSSLLFLPLPNFFASNQKCRPYGPLKIYLEAYQTRFLKIIHDFCIVSSETDQKKSMKAAPNRPQLRSQNS